VWANTLIFISAYKIGDLASLAGVLISLVGFAVTVVSVLKSRRAAERAQIAAKAARDWIRLFETVVYFTQGSDQPSYLEPRSYGEAEHRYPGGAI
jgi:hypothetical protein